MDRDESGASRGSCARARYARTEGRGDGHRAAQRFGARETVPSGVDGASAAVWVPPGGGAERWRRRDGDQDGRRRARRSWRAWRGKTRAPRRSRWVSIPRRVCPCPRRRWRRRASRGEELRGGGGGGGEGRGARVADRAPPSPRSASCSRTCSGRRRRRSRSGGWTSPRTCGRRAGKHGEVCHAFVDALERGVRLPQIRDDGGRRGPPDAPSRAVVRGRTVGAEFQFTQVYDRHFHL